MSSNIYHIDSHFISFVDNNSISAKVQIVQYPEVVREVPGTRKDMQCTATGDPPPIITWLKDGTPVNDSNFPFHIYTQILPKNI